MKAQIRHSQVCLRHPLWLLLHPVRVLLALEQTLLFNHILLNTRTPVLFPLVLEQTLEPNRYLLTAPLHRQQPPGWGEPSHRLWGGYSQACPQCPLPLMGTQLLMRCV